MLPEVSTYGLLILLICSPALSLAQGTNSKRPWKGYSILGNGHLTVVYSDDSRISASTHAKGIQHLYFRDYTADYVASTSFHLPAPNAAHSIGMKNFFTTQTHTHLSNGSTKTILCFVHPDDAVILSLRANGASAKESYEFEAALRADGLNGIHQSDSIAVAIWSNGTALAVAPKSPHDNASASGSSISVTGTLSPADNRAEVLLIPAASEAEAISKVHAFQHKNDIEAEAKKYWESWINAGRLPVFPKDDAQAAQYLEAYKRNLYCVKAANLNGQIPADITGQFVTNNMPQLYPRDAMMCARVLLLTGHAEEAKQVIEFWAKIPRKTPGEWYARYDAHGNAVDAGSGARFDEPEWDSNGYYIYLLSEYHRIKSVWLTDSKLIYQLADFLVSHISPNGLLQEGGIVEWTGYLPATNMICSAALQTAANIASGFGDKEKAATYSAATRRISAALPQMFDKSRQTYADVRFTDRKGANGESLTGQYGQQTFLWDTTANVGAIWGYPNHHALELSNAFYAKNTVKLGGGMQYFDSPDPGLAAYGHDVFFFTTAAAAQYEAMYGNKSTAKRFIDWMLRNANSYGLMPERIFLNESDCSPASPLSWCSAEFAAALLRWNQP